MKMRTFSGRRVVSCVLLFLIFLHLGRQAAGLQVSEKVPLRILSLLTDPTAQNGSLLSTVRTAEKHVNEREGLLDGYELKVVTKDGGCDATTSTDLFSFVTQVFGRPRGNDTEEVVGVVGPLCPESAQAIADLADRPQISINSIHLASSMDTNPRNFSFSMLGPASDILATIVAFTQHAGWKRICILYESYSSFYDRLYRSVLDGVEGIVSETEVLGVSDDNMDTIPDALSAVQNSGFRVIFLLTGKQLASRVLCLSVTTGLTYPNYQFVLVRGSVQGIQSEEWKSCQYGFNGTLLIFHKTTSSHKHPDYTTVDDSDTILSSEFLGPLLYDSVWALALALNNSIKPLEEIGFSLADYKYGMPEASKIIEEELFQLQFQGVSGKIDFRREDGFSERSIEVTQVVGGQEVRGVPFADYTSGNFNVLLSNVTLGTIEDSFPRWIPAIHIAWSIVFFIILFAHLAVLITVHTGLIVYRHQSWVKASSNRMNQFNIIGNYLILLGLFLHNIIHAFVNKLSHQATGAICHTTWGWVLSIGSTLVIGSLILKTWRLYRIFIHYLNPGVISDLVLSLFLTLLVGIDVVIAIIWTATDPIRVRVESETITNRDGQILIQQSIACASNSIQMWLILIMLYKILQIGALLTLTILTRKINNKKYTTLYMRIVSYTFSFTIGFGLTMFYFLFFIAGGTIADDIVLNLVLNSLVLQNILLVFLPSLIPVLKEKFKTSGTYTTSS